MSSLPAITVLQPWASLIALSAKPFETRGYPPPAKHIGRRIAIHAAKRPVFLDSLSADIWRAFADHFDGPLIAGPKAALGAGLPRGAVVCTAILAAAYQCGPALGGDQVAVDRSIGGKDRPVAIRSDALGDFSPGRWAWLLEDIELIDPAAPATGKQGWWSWAPSAFPAITQPHPRLATAPGGHPASPQE